MREERRSEEKRKKKREKSTTRDHLSFCVFLFSQLGQETELAKNDNISKRLWEVSQKITGLANF